MCSPITFHRFSRHFQKLRSNVHSPESVRERDLSQWLFKFASKDPEIVNDFQTQLNYSIIFNYLFSDEKFLQKTRVHITNSSISNNSTTRVKVTPAVRTVQVQTQARHQKARTMMSDLKIKNVFSVVALSWKVSTWKDVSHPPRISWCVKPTGNQVLSEVPSWNEITPYWGLILKAQNCYGWRNTTRNRKNSQIIKFKAAGQSDF